MTIKQRPFKGLLGGYLPFERPFYKTSYKPYTEEDAKKKKKEKTTHSVSQNSTIGQPVSAMPSYEIQDFASPMKNHYRPVDKMTNEELAKEYENVSWVNDNIGISFGKSNSKDDKSKVAPLFQTALAAVAPPVGVFAQLVNGIAGYQKRRIEDELQKRNVSFADFDKGVGKDTLAGAAKKDVLQKKVKKQPAAQPSQPEYESYRPDAFEREWHMPESVDHKDAGNRRGRER